MKNNFQIEYDTWHAYRTLSFRVLTLAGLLVFLLKKYDLIGDYSSLVGLSISGLMILTLMTFFKTAILANQKGVQKKEGFQSELAANQVHLDSENRTKIIST